MKKKKTYYENHNHLFLKTLLQHSLHKRCNSSFTLSKPVNKVIITGPIKQSDGSNSQSKTEVKGEISRSHPVPTQQTGSHSVRERLPFQVWTIRPKLGREALAWRANVTFLSTRREQRPWHLTGHSFRTTNGRFRIPSTRAGPGQCKWIQLHADCNYTLQSRPVVTVLHGGGMSHCILQSSHCNYAPFNR